jgi:hypothetical protein
MHEACQDGAVDSLLSFKSLIGNRLREFQNDAVKVGLWKFGVDVSSKW